MTRTIRKGVKAILAFSTEGLYSAQARQVSVVTVGSPARHRHHSLLRHFIRGVRYFPAIAAHQAGARLSLPLLRPPVVAGARAAPGGQDPFAAAPHYRFDHVRLLLQCGFRRPALLIRVRPDRVPDI